MHPSCQTLGPKSMNAKSARSYGTRTSLRSSFPVGTQVLSPPPGLESRFARAVRASPASAPPALCRERAIPSRARWVTLVRQSIQSRAFAQALCFMQEKNRSALSRELPLSCTHRRPPTVALRHAVSQAVPLQRSWCRPPRPNPSVEGTAKRLRLLSAPHLER